MRSYSHLSEDERDQIGVLRSAGRSIGWIARVLGRAKATISRELRRNALPSGGYSPLHAAGAYTSRRRREAIRSSQRLRGSAAQVGGRAYIRVGRKMPYARQRFRTHYRQRISMGG
jgi:IS30 family transposase